MLLKTRKSILPIRGIYIDVLPLITIRLFANYNPDGSTATATATNTNTKYGFAVLLVTVIAGVSLLSGYYYY